MEGHKEHNNWSNLGPQFGPARQYPGHHHRFQREKLHSFSQKPASETNSKAIPWTFGFCLIIVRAMFVQPSGCERSHDSMNVCLRATLSECARAGGRVCANRS